MKDLLKIKNLNLSFNTIDGKVKVLKNINFSIPLNNVVGIIGETGCGKSLTTKIIMGLLNNKNKCNITGNIFYNDQDLLAMSKKEKNKIIKNKISYIPQDPMVSLNPVFKIGTIISDVIRWYDSEQRLVKYLFYGKGKKKRREIKKRAIELLKIVEINDPEEILNNYPSQLSGGMMQRILIAIALIKDTEILIADEPTTALDVTIQNNIIELLKKKVNNMNLTSIYVTHNLGVAREICDLICVMYGGTIVEIGETEEVIKKPLHPYTKGLINSIPNLVEKKLPEGIEGKILDYLNPPRGCRFYPRCKKRQAICKSNEPGQLKIGEKRMVKCHLY